MKKVREEFGRSINTRRLTQNSSMNFIARVKINMSVKIMPLVCYQYLTAVFPNGHNANSALYCLHYDRLGRQRSSKGYELGAWFSHSLLRSEQSITRWNARSTAEFDLEFSSRVRRTEHCLIAAIFGPRSPGTARWSISDHVAQQHSILEKPSIDHRRWTWILQMHF